MDAKRAPRFLMLLKQPQGVSSQHWRFQSKLHQVKCDSEREELILSGSPFPASEQAAWWLAYDAASLADRELSAADSLLRDHHIERPAAREIAGIKVRKASPARFRPKTGTRSIPRCASATSSQSSNASVAKSFTATNPGWPCAN